MADVQLVVTFGLRCHGETRDTIQKLLSLLPQSRKKYVKLVDDKNQNFDVEADIGVSTSYGQDAVDYVYNYIQTILLDESSKLYPPPSPETYYSAPPIEPVLKVTYPPYSGASHRSPAIGPGAYYIEHKYMPEEGSGLYPRDIFSYRYIPPRDSKTRLPVLR